MLKFGRRSLILMALAQAAAAQNKDTTNIDKTKNSPSRGIEEVIVTAEKRAANVQDIPIAIQAFTGDKLVAEGVTNPKQLAELTPGLVYNSVISFDIIYLRGVGTNVFIPSSSPAVGSYIDGVFYPFSFGLARDFGKTKSVSVLKGPQGTLFGRNTTGGAISIETAEPNEQEWEGTIDYEVASFNTQRRKIYASGPVTDWLAVAGSALYNTNDDYYELHPDSPLKKLDSDESKGYQLRARVAPIDEFDITLSYTDTEYEIPSTGRVVMDKTLPIGETAQLKEYPRDYRYPGNEQGIGGGASEVYTLHANWRPGPIDVKAIVGKQDHKASQTIDFDGNPLPIIHFFSDDGLFSEVESYELQFLSNEDGWFSSFFDSPVTWVGGLYYSDTRQGFAPVQFEVGDTALGGELIPFPDLILDLLPIELDTGTSVVTAGIDTFENAGIFGQITWDPLDWLGITVGARYTQESVELTDSDVRLRPNSDTGYTGGVGDIPVFNYADRRLENEDISPRLRVNLRPMDEVLIYLSYSQGFQSGTFNIINLTAEPSEVEPSKTTTMELGWKTRLFDGLVEFNGAIFRNEIQDQQAIIVSLQSGGVATIENAAQSTIDGAEFTLQWAASDYLTVALAGSYLDGIYDSYPDAGEFNENTGLYSNTGDFTGNETERAPDYTGNLSLNYTRPLGDGEIEAAASYYYNDGYFFDAQNIAEQPSYATVNARIGYWYAPWDLRFTVFGRNLSDENYLVNSFTLDTGTVVRQAMPANYGLRVNWGF